MSVDYQYTKSPVDPDSLRLEILDESNITTEFEYSMFTAPDDLTLRFVSTLSPTEELYLDAVVSGHAGITEYVPSTWVMVSTGDGTGYFYPIDVSLSGVSLSQYIQDSLYFTNLYDVPNTYSGSQYLYPRVNSTVSGLEFAPADALYLNGIVVDNSSLADGYILRYNEDADDLQYESIRNIIREEYGVFGENATHTESEEESSTTSDLWQEKLSCTISGLEYGSYRIGWRYQWQIDNSNFKFRARLQLNDDFEAMYHEERPANAGSWSGESGFYYVTTSGTLKMDLDFASETTGKTASIRRARLEFWGVS